MPQEVLLLAARYIALFGLVVSIALIFVRWRFPKKESKGDKGSGSREKEPSYWQVFWYMRRKAKAKAREREGDLRAIRGKSVLVVDPDEKSSKVLIWRLEQLGCKVVKARSGSQAVGMASSVDVVISDALLPDISAVEFCDALAGSDVPIVLVGVLRAQREELARLGDRVACLGKPYDPDDAAVLAGRALRICDLRFAISN